MRYTFLNDRKAAAGDDEEFGGLHVATNSLNGNRDTINELGWNPASSSEEGGRL